jgi:hypothetical protein
VKRQLDQAGLTRGQYRFIVSQVMLREKLGEAFGDEVPNVDKHVQVEHLEFSSQETADRAHEALDLGESWQDVAARFAPPPEEEEEAEEAETEAEPEEAEPAESEPAEPEPAEEPGESAEAEAEGEGATTEGPETEAEESTAAEAVTTTGEITTTGEVTPTVGVTGTATITPTVAPTRTPAPTPTPNPFATVVGEAEWMTRDQVKSRLGFSDTAADDLMALEPGGFSEVIEVAGSRYYIVRLVDVDEERELDAEELETRKESALDDWIESRTDELEASGEIDRFPLEAVTPPEPDWFSRMFDDLVQQPQPTLDLDALQIPTAAPDDGAEEGGEPAATGEPSVPDEQGDAGEPEDEGE